MDMIIRQARKDEAARIAQLFMLAWPAEEMAASNGITMEQMLESVTAFAAAPDTIYSWRNTFVAEVYGTVAGAMCGYDGADYQILKQPIVNILGKDSAFAELQETEAGEYYIDSVGVLPEYRGRGIASRLFKAHFAHAAALGHKTAGLIVDVDKPEAEALYERLGFVQAGFRDFFGHQMKHMTKDLEKIPCY